MSFIKNSVILGAALLLSEVSAHGIVSGILAEGKYYAGANAYSNAVTPGWKAANGDNGFASSLTSSDVICHNSATPGQAYVAVTAGSSIELQWTVWPESHKGPMIDYLAPCGDDCTTVKKETLQFTKIDEAGLIDAASDPQVWASDEMISNNNTWVTTIPASIAPGKYVLRHETIALHSAGSAGGAQSYPQCINLEVSGSGTNSLSSGTLGTKLYTETDPGILVNIYYPKLTSYSIPGPALMAGGSGSGSAPSKSASASKPATSAASSVATSASVSVTASVTTGIAVVSTTTSVAPVGNASSTTSAASFTATATGSAGTPRKFVCYEEL